MKVKEYINQYLYSQNTKQVFGVSGANIEDLFEEIFLKKSIQIILAKNEYNAATMALGSYLFTKKPAIVLTTSGPGILNTIPVLAEGFTSKIPLILISGLVNNTNEGNGAFQDTSGKNGTINILEMLSTCTSYVIKIESADEIKSALINAHKFASDTLQPVAILIPRNIFTEELSSIDGILESLKNEPEVKPIFEIQKLEKFCGEFSKISDKNPLIILGEELINLDNINEITNFAKNTSAYIALTTNAKGLYDHLENNFIGLTGIMGHSEVKYFIKDASHIIMIGCKFDLLDSFGIMDELHLKKVFQIKYQKSLNDVFKRINIKHPPKNILDLKPIKNDLLTIATMFENISKNLPIDANVFIDAGNTGAFAVHHLKTRGLGTVQVSLGMGGMGNSIGMGIGCAASSLKKTFVILGDGSFLMYGLEIHTAIEYNLPIVFIIFNNQSHGMCSTREDIFLTGESGLNNFRQSFFADGLKAMFKTLITYEINSVEELEISLNKSKNYSTPIIISINIDNKEKPPFKSFYK